VKKVMITLCTFSFSCFFTARCEQFLGAKGDAGDNAGNVTVEKRLKRAGATPLFCGQAAQKFRGVTPALRHKKSVPFLFSTVTKNSAQRNMQRRRTMPIVKKAPGITNREVKLEEPVNQLLEDYARFIESSPDHVINSVLKKLWRDQDYRKWRDQRRGGQSGSPNVAQHSDLRGRA
jgi:hypothetical protein